MHRPERVWVTCGRREFQAWPAGRSDVLGILAFVVMSLAGCATIPDPAIYEARHSYAAGHPGAESYRVGEWRMLDNCLVMELQGSAGTEVIALARSSAGLERWWVADAQPSNDGETYKLPDRHWQQRYDAARAEGMKTPDGQPIPRRSS